MKPCQKFILLVIASIVVVVLSPTLTQSQKEQGISISFPAKKITVTAEIADTPELQWKGLMNRTHLPDGNGMFFIFDSQGEKRFWMKNTLIPLDMLFISENYTIVNISKNAKPCILDPCMRYSSGVPVKYVLEVNAGFTEMNGIHIGDTILLR